MLVGPADMYRNDLSPVTFLEKWIHYLQQQCLHACGSLRDFRIHLHLPVQVDAVVDNFVGAVQSRRSARHVERQIGKGRYPLVESNLSLQVGKDGLGIVFVLSSGSRAQLVDISLSLWLGEAAFVDAEGAL